MDSKMKSSSLVRMMEKYYVDADGYTVKDAVQLGIAIMYFYHGIHEAKESAGKEVGPQAIAWVDEFVYSITMEHFSLERFNKNRQLANVHIDSIAEKAPKTGDILRSWLYSPVMDILENKIYRAPTACLPLHVLICEGGMRLYNAYVFSGSEHKEEGFDEIAFANFQCSAHVLAFIAFLVSNSANNYLLMNMEVEKYMHDISRHLLKLE